MSSSSHGYSLKRRISSTYIGVYVGISVLMILSIIIGCAFYADDKYEDPSDFITDSISEKLSESGTIVVDEFRSFLYETSIYGGAREIFLYNTNNELLIATSYTRDNEDYFAASGNNLILKLFPQFVYLAEDLLVKESVVTVENDSVSYDVRIIMHFSIEDEISIFRYLINMSLALLVVGMVLFILFGVSKTHHMLSPINEMTETVKMINAENMNQRIENTDAKFELSELAETINSMMDRLQSSYDKQKRFVSDVSHELRTPISVISGYANMLKRWGKDDPEILEEGIENIIEEAETMNELVQTLLFLARHDNETLKFEPADTDVSDLVSEIVKDTAMANPDVKIVSQIDAPLVSCLDGARFKQAVRVFVDNAIKYSKEGDKQIYISLKKMPEHFEVSVSDNGIGISGEDLRRIFDRFYRADESRTKNSGGFGLGLSIAKVIVLAHGGKIKVRSKPGAGSEFTVIMPYTTDSVPMN